MSLIIHRRNDNFRKPFKWNISNLEFLSRIKLTWMFTLYNFSQSQSKTFHFELIQKKNLSKVKYLNSIKHLYYIHIYLNSETETNLIYSIWLPKIINILFLNI